MSTKTVFIIINIIINIIIIIIFIYTSVNHFVSLQVLQYSQKSYLETIFQSLVVYKNSIYDDNYYDYDYDDDYYYYYLYISKSFRFSPSPTVRNGNSSPAGRAPAGEET